MTASAQGSSPAGRSTVASTMIAVGIVLAGLTVLGVVSGYAMALLVVTVDMLSPKLFVGVPLVLVGATAWAFAGSIPDWVTRLSTVLVAGGIAVSLLVVLDTKAPAELFSHTSEVTDVDMSGDETTMTIRTKTSMKEMPSFSDIAGLAALLASLAIAGAALGRPVFDRYTASKRSPLEDEQDS